MKEVIDGSFRRFKAVIIIHGELGSFEPEAKSELNDQIKQRMDDGDYEIDVVSILDKDGNEIGALL